MTRRAVLILLIVTLVPAFAITGVVVRADRRYLSAEASRWRQQGVRDLDARRPDAAVEAFRVTLARGGDDPAVRMQLAQALIAAGRTTEAESHLRTLWAGAPGDGPVNLALARLASASGRTDEALRYYHAAIDGAWERNPQLSRRGARFELARMLLRQRRPTEARSELIVLADAVKDDPGQTLAVARMLVDAGDARTALTLAHRVLMARPADVDALTLAGGLEFRDANYAGARVLLQRAARERPLADEVESELRDATEALALDPLAARLGSVARLGRMRRVLMAVQQRVDACIMAAGGQPSPDLQALADRVMAVGRSAAKSRRADADDLDEAMAVTAAVEEYPDTMCGPSSPEDRILRLVLRAHSST